MSAFTHKRLAHESERYRGTGGVSAENRELGFRPAFFDRATLTIYPSRYADGRLAPFHVLDGLPGPLVASRDRNGRIVGVKPSVVAGFIRGGRFYTRAQAARTLDGG